MLLSELAHMKNLYNDIIYFIQNHVKPVPFDQRNTHAIPKLIELDSLCEAQNVVGVHGAKGCNLGNKSLVTSTEDTNSTVKLFGVPLRGKKRLHSEELKFGVSDV